MDSRKELDEFEGWTQIFSPNDDLQKKLAVTESEKKILKQEVEKYLQDTMDVLKSVDLAKLDFEKNAAEFKKTNDTLEDEIRVLLQFKDDLINKNSQLKKQNQRLKKLLKKNTHNKRLQSLLMSITNKLIAKAEELESLVDKYKIKDSTDQKDYQETQDKLREATVWADHFEKITIQRNTEIIALKKENASLKTIIDQLSFSNKPLQNRAKEAVKLAEEITQSENLCSEKRRINQLFFQKMTSPCSSAVTTPRSRLR